MDVVLNKIGNQPELKSVDGLFDAVQEAKAMIQVPLAQCCQFEKRQKCLACFTIALAAAKPKFAALAFEGIQLILRDHQTLGSEERTPEGQSRAEQLLSLFAAIPNWRNAPTTQCQALTLLVQLVSSIEIPVKLKELLHALEICKRTFDTALTESTTVRPAVRAALTQMLNSYVQSRLALVDNEETVEIGALMDVTALLADLVARMGQAIEEAMEQRNSDPKSLKLQPQPLLLPLDALFSVLSAMEPAHFERHQPLFNALKAELLPVIICHLHGSAKSASPTGGDLTASKRIGALLKRGAGRLSTDMMPTTATCLSGIALDGVESARSFYQVVEQLFRLFTPMALGHQQKAATSTEMLFLLEELWRSALLAPPVAKRVEAVRLVKRLCNNSPSFCALIQLSVASGADTFWLLLLECLEECCTAASGGEQRLALDSLRSLNALFMAIHHLVILVVTDDSSSPKKAQQQFPAEFFTRLAQLEGNDDAFAGADGHNNSSAIDEESTKTRRRSSAAPPQIHQPEPAAKLFIEAFTEQLLELHKCDSDSALDAQMQQFALATTARLNALMRPLERKGPRQSDDASTPEDSDAEEEEGNEAQQKVKNGRELEEVELFAMANTVLWELEWNGQRADWVRAREGKARATAEANEVVAASRDMNLFLLPSSPNSASGQLLQGILRCIRAQSQSHCQQFPASNANKLLRLFGPDPLGSTAGDDQNQRNRLLCARWLAHRLHNCWGSILRMFDQFPVRKGCLEEGKFVTVEALASFVPLATELGLAAELCWAMDYIGEQVCALEELREAVQRKRGGEDPKSARRFCGRAELSAVQVLMENAVSALAIVPDAAKHVIRCIQFLWELERWHFKLAKATIDAIYEPPSLPVPPSRSGQNSPIGQLIGSTLPAMGELSSNELARLMDQFLALIDRFFSDAATLLPLDSFCALLSAIGNANEDNLLYSSESVPIETSAQLLQRLCQLVCAKGHSPFVAKLASWCRVKDHFMLCASANRIPPEISRRAVDGLQDMLTILLHKEWGEPLANNSEEKHRATVLHGWNAILFDVFPALLAEPTDGTTAGGAQCTTETCLQVAQVLLTFVAENFELLGTGWPRLFAAVKMLAQCGYAEINTAGNSIALCSLAIDVLDKFLAIRKPVVLIVAFNDFTNALVHCIGLACSADEQQGADESSRQQMTDRLLALLERAEQVLLDCLFGSVVPLSALPRGLSEKADELLDTMWRDFCRESNVARGEKDYLQLLPDLKTEIDDHQLMEQDSALKQWLDGDGPATMANRPIENLEPPWRHLSVPNDRIVALAVVELLNQLTDMLLDRHSNRKGRHISTGTRQARLMLNGVEFLGRITAEIGPNFGVFTACFCLLANFKEAISCSALTNSSARALKQFLGIVCSHNSVKALLDTLDQESDGLLASGWRICLLHQLLSLAVACVAKGGILSLAGCALLQRLFLIVSAAIGPVADQQTMLSMCAHSVWLASRYALFPTRMLIAQFFVNSTDFSGDLGQMKVSYRLGLDPSEVEERVDNVQQLANQVFHLECQLPSHRGKEEGQASEEQQEEEESGAHFPAMFAYLFLFESSADPKDVGTTASKKMSMGLDELVDSLLCQQLLVQLCAQQLDANNREPNEVVAAPLLAVLNATLAVCGHFEQRPGLKSLLQKLTGLPSAANLWTLSLAVSTALIRYELGMAVKATGTEQREKHVKRIAKLLDRTFGTARLNSANSPIVDRITKQISGDEKMKQQPLQQQKQLMTHRANPFISHQPSQESRSDGIGRQTEALKTRSLALGKLLSQMLVEANLQDKEIHHLMAEHLRAITEAWDDEKAKEVVGDFVEKLKQ